MKYFFVVLSALSLTGCGTAVFCESVKSMYQGQCFNTEYGDILQSNYTAHQLCKQQLDECRKELVSIK